MGAIIPPFPKEHMYYNTEQMFLSSRRKKERKTAPWSNHPLPPPAPTPSRLPSGVSRGAVAVFGRLTRGVSAVFSVLFHLNRVLLAVLSKFCIVTVSQIGAM